MGKAWSTFIPREGGRTPEKMSESRMLCRAMMSADRFLALHLILHIKGVNELCPDLGLAPLHVAAERADWEYITALLQRGADINITDCRLFTPLHLACAAGDVEVDGRGVDALLDGGAGVNSRDVWGKTPLHRAVIYRCPLTVCKLLQVGASVNITDVEERSVLTYLAHTPRSAPWQAIIDHVLPGCEVRGQKDHRGRTPLYYAVLTDNVYLVDALVARGGAGDLCKPLEQAIIKDNMRCVSLLLQQGAPVTQDLMRTTLRRLHTHSLSKALVMLRLVQQAYGQAATLSFVMEAVLVIADHVEQSGDDCEAQLILSTMCSLLAANSYPLTAFLPMLGRMRAVRGHKFVDCLRDFFGYTTVAPLAYLCRTVLRNRLHASQGNVSAGVCQLPILPKIIREFILLQEL